MVPVPQQNQQQTPPPADPQGQGQTPPPAQQGQAAPEPRIYLSPDEYAALVRDREQFNAFKSAQQLQQEAAENARLQALAAKGEVETAFNQYRELSESKVKAAEERAARLEAERLDEKVDLSLSDLLLGVKFVSPHAAAQMKQALKGRLVAERTEAGAVIIRDRVTRRPAAEVVGEWVKSEEFSHFLDPRSRGGSGATASAGNAGSAQIEQPAQPANLGEAIVMQWQQREAANPSSRWMGVGGRAPAANRN